MPNEPSHALGVVRTDVIAAALPGLSAPRKTLPPALFYDETGCRLFYEITKLPEYYLTRTETALLGRIGLDLVPDGITGATLVEFGGSDETKARHLLDLPGGRFDSYVTIDVAGEALQAMRLRMQHSHPHLRVVPIVADFMKTLTLPRYGGPRFGFFPGSTIGNLDPGAAIAFLASARASLGTGSWFLLGADLRKDRSLLLPAYNDSAGVTAAFNLNLLTRLNREAEANFDLDDFRHEAIWNDAESRIEMHLVSLRDHIVDVAGRPIRFRRGETIHTENSYKHSKKALIAITSQAGWETQRLWTDDAGYFGVFLLRAPD